MIKNQPENKFFKIFPGLKKRKESVIKKQGVCLDRQKTKNNSSLAVNPNSKE